jgi:hypothetical protein
MVTIQQHPLPQQRINLYSALWMSVTMQQPPGLCQYRGCSTHGRMFISGGEICNYLSTGSTELQAIEGQAEEMCQQCTANDTQCCAA